MLNHELQYYVAGARRLRHAHLGFSFVSSKKWFSVSRMKLLFFKGPPFLISSHIYFLVALLSSARCSSTSLHLGPQPHSHRKRVAPYILANRDFSPYQLMSKAGFCSTI